LKFGRLYSLEIFVGPTALLSHKIGFGRRLTSFPSLKDKFSQNYEYSGDRVVQDSNLITSQGPGTTFEFALKIVEYLEGAEKMQSVKQPMRLNF
jgi:protein DJ-1